MLPFDLSNKVAIVTGGGVGIGKAIALELAKAGADVVISSRKKEVIEKAVADVKALGKRSMSIVTDVCIDAQVDNLIQQTVDKFGGVDILVNNAGFVLQCPPEDIRTEDWDNIMNVNLRGTFLCSRAAGKAMIAQKRGGKIINISSIAALAATPEAAHYGAAKAGVISFTHSLAAAWAKHKIYVNCIVPGPIKTEGLIAIMHIKPEEEELVASRLPVGRFGKPEDIAYLAIFLASAAFDFITGEAIPVTGGLR